MTTKPDLNKARVVNLEEVLNKRRADAEKARAPGSRPMRRPRSEETFARIPHDRARKLFRHLGRPAWMLLIELDRLILTGRGRNPLKLTSEALRGSGLTRRQIERGLYQLEHAKIITVERKRGRCPLVTHLWYPIHI